MTDRSGQPAPRRSPEEPPGLELAGLGKQYRDRTVLSGVSLTVGRGELVAVLGSSGAGKTTILRCIAGHLEPDEGEVRIGGASMSGVPPERRQVGLVFQSYALFPHLSVRRNVAFGPERHGRSRAAALERADALLERLGLTGLGGRYPRQISGGEQQRVAVARALAIEPEVLLLDEPLSSLDAALRRDLRLLLRELQRAFAATTLWVTHDQEEALTVADRVALLHEGRIQQVGTPLELHTRPANPFVAAFVGKMNLLPADREPGALDAFRLRSGPSVRVAPDSLPEIGATAEKADPAIIGMRPEVVRIGHPPPTPGFNTAMAEVKRIVFLGDRLEIELALTDEVRLFARGNALFTSRAREGDRVRIHWPVADTRLL